MIEVYLYGNIKKIVEQNFRDASSIMLFDYVEGENLQDFLQRLGLEPVDIGHCVVNRQPANFDHVLHDHDTIELNPKKD